MLRSCLLVLQFIRAADVGALAVAPNLAAAFSRIIDASGEAPGDEYDSGDFV